jgi:predicted amidohydrolase
MSLTLTLIQSQLHWEDKTANLRMFEEKISGIREKTEVVVLPEMFSTGFSMKASLLAETMEGETVNWMRRVAMQKRIIVTGSLIIEEEGRYYNRLVWMLPTGQYGYYNKRHCFAFAGENEYYTPGNKRLITSVKGWKINLQICYDLRFPVWARQACPSGHLTGGENQPEYDLLLYVANWPGGRSYAWRSLLVARAIENQCYVVGVNRVGRDGNDIYYSGDSMVIDPSGEIVYRKTEEEAIYTLTLEKEKIMQIRSKFPFLKDADKFMIINE